MSEQDNHKPIVSIFLAEDTFGYETELSPEEMIFWLDVVKASVINRVLETGSSE